MKQTSSFKLKVLLVLCLTIFSNCSKDHIISDSFENIEMIETVSINEIKDLFKKSNSLNAVFSKSNSYYATPDLSKIKQEVIKNSQKFITVIPATTPDKNVNSRIVLLKINNEVKSVVFNMVSSKKVKSQKFTGKIFITKLDGSFLYGYSVNKGEIITKLIKSKSHKSSKDITLKSLNLMAEVNPESESDDCPYSDPSWCQFDEVVIIANSYDNTIPIPYLFDYYSGYGGYDDSFNDYSWNYGIGEIYDYGGDSPNTPAPDEIINNLDGKSLCVWEKLQKNSLLNNLLKKFEGEGTPVHLILNPENLEDSTSGETYYGTGIYITISIDKSHAINDPSLDVAHTILHEAIHAKIFQLIKTRSGLHLNSFNQWELGSGAKADFPTLFKYYNDDPENPHHNYMADFYRDEMEDGLRKYATLIGKTYPDQLYKDLAWSGLQETKA